VKVVRADIESSKIDFVLVEATEAEAGAEKPSRRKKSAKRA
jgi:hypothetical protein